MSRRSAFVLSVRKDLRAMAPALATSVGVMAVALLLGRRFSMSGYSVVRLMGLAAYVLGAVALGALSVGHGSAHRTLGWLLVQPVSRRSLLLSKGLSLAIVMLVLVIAGFLFLTISTTLDLRLGSMPGRMLVRTSTQSTGIPPALIALPLLCGLFVAPWLTMVFRNVLAGIVFTIFVPALVWLIADAVISLQFRSSGYAPSQMRDLSVQVLWYWSIAFCTVGAVFWWRHFMRLEARDDPAMGFALVVGWAFDNSRRTRPSSPTPCTTPARRMFPPIHRDRKCAADSAGPDHFASTGLTACSGW